MKKIFSILIIGLLCCCFASCDKIEGPYVQSNENEPITAEIPALDKQNVYRKVLIEEYTGHRCPNCPNGHRKLEELHGIFGDTLVAISIHYGSLAALTPEYTYNFTTEVGNELGNDFGINGIPCAIINRYPKKGGYSLTQWQNKIKEVDRKKTFAAIQMVNQFNYPSENKLKVNVKVTMLEDYSAPLRLALYIIEDNIIKPQLDGKETIAEYTHNHVLRGAINSTYGSLLNGDGMLVKDGEYTYGKTIDFAGHDWNPDNCAVVAILYDKTNGDVLQVEKVNVK